MAKPLYRVYCTKPKPKTVTKEIKVSFEAVKYLIEHMTATTAHKVLSTQELSSLID